MPNQHTHTRFQDLGLGDQDLERLPEHVQGCGPYDDLEAEAERILKAALDAQGPQPSD